MGAAQSGWMARGRRTGHPAVNHPRAANPAQALASKREARPAGQAGGEPAGDVRKRLTEVRRADATAWMRRRRAGAC